MVLKRSLLAGLVAVLIAALNVQDAQAFGRFRGGWGSGGSWGSRGSWGSYGGSWGSYGSHGSYGSWGSHGSYGSHGSHGGYSVSYRYDGPYYSSSRVVYGRVVESSSEAVRESRDRVAETAPKTRLTLRVPADAEVTLAGDATAQRGEVRRFLTTRLAPGESWDEYPVVARIERDGQVYTERRNITLVGGESQELSIEFSDARIAQTTH